MIANQICKKAELIKLQVLIFINTDEFQFQFDLEFKLIFLLVRQWGVLGRLGMLVESSISFDSNFALPSNRP